MRYPTRVRAEARTQVSPWWFWALAAVAAVFLSFGCHGSFYDSDYENGGGAGGEGGDDGGAAGTPLVITSTLSSTEVNEINGDEIGVVKFSFDMPVDQESAADYITLYAQYVDGTEEAIPINAIFWSEDGLSVELSFAAAYNTSYLVNFSAGLKSADLTATLMENITYQLKTLRNPLDIDGAAGDRADVVVGNALLYNEMEELSSIGAILSGNDIISDKMVEMTIRCSLMDANCTTADYMEGIDLEGNEIVLAGREIVPWNSDGLPAYAALGEDAQNLGNVSGDWRADAAFSAVEGVSQQYCDEGMGECLDGNCQIPEQDLGIPCGCQAQEFCSVYSYPNNPFQGLCLDNAWTTCTTANDCVDQSGNPTGQECIDFGIGTSFCSSGPCNDAACGGWPNYCKTGVEPYGCYQYAQDYGPCLQDQQSRVLIWNDPAAAAPATVLGSAVTFRSDSKPYPAVVLFTRPIGDVNADGRADFIVVEQVLGEVALEQEFYLFLGRDAFAGELLLSAADASWTPLAAVPGLEPAASASLPPGLSPEMEVLPPLVAISIAGVGDVNGDGLNDFAIGSIEQDTFWGGSSAGVVQLFFGAADIAALKAPDVTITSGEAADLFGMSLAGGDVDGDGKADLLVGAPGAQGGGAVGVNNLAVMPFLIGRGELPASLTNHAYLFSGAMLTAGEIAAADATAIFGDSGILGASPMLGLAVAVTDLNGDRLGDVAIGEPFMPTENSQGRVGIFLGKKGGISGAVEMASADLFINHNWPMLYDEWGNPGDLYSLGVLLSAIGDINNDGYKDLAVAGITRSLWGGMARDGNYLCMFPGSASLGEINLDCDNSNAWVDFVALPDLLVRILGGGRVK